METIRYIYLFEFPDRTRKQIQIDLDPTTLEFIRTSQTPARGWTKLKHFQCSNCPLDDGIEFCPVAVNLSAIVEVFKDRSSFDQVRVTVHSEQRNYEQETSLQKGLSSIIGICMVTSNCPIMDQLRPNVRFHLPFASALETSYRAIATYLVDQYFMMRQGGTPDWQLVNLADTYKAVACVDRGMSARLAAASTQDANVNALIILASQGTHIDNFLEDSLREIEPLFKRNSTPPKNSSITE